MQMSIISLFRSSLLRDILSQRNFIINHVVIRSVKYLGNWGNFLRLNIINNYYKSELDEKMYNWHKNFS